MRRRMNRRFMGYGLGPCGMGMGGGMGMGLGRSLGYCPWCGKLSKEERKEILENQISFLRETLEELEKELKDLR